MVKTRKMRNVLGRYRWGLLNVCSRQKLSFPKISIWGHVIGVRSIRKVLKFPTTLFPFCILLKRMNGKTNVRAKYFHFFFPLLIDSLVLHVRQFSMLLQDAGECTDLFEGRITWMNEQRKEFTITLYMWMNELQCVINMEPFQAGNILVPSQPNPISEMFLTRVVKRYQLIICGLLLNLKIRLVSFGSVQGDCF